MYLQQISGPQAAANLGLRTSLHLAKDSDQDCRLLLDVHEKQMLVPRIPTAASNCVQSGYMTGVLLVPVTVGLKPYRYQLGPGIRTLTMRYKCSLDPYYSS